MEHLPNAPTKKSANLRNAKWWWTLALGLLIGLLLAIVLPSVFGNVDSGGMQKGRTRAEIQVVAALITQYQSTHRHYPGNLDELINAIPSKPSVHRQRQRWLKFDRWGNAVIYRFRGTAYPVVYSVGANGIDDGGESDDIIATTH